MKLTRHPHPQRGSALVAFLLIAAVTAFAISSVALFVSQSTKLTNRRDDWNAAYHYAESGVSITCDLVDKAFTNTTGTLLARLISTNTGFTTFSSNTTQIVLISTNTSVFSNQALVTKLYLTNSLWPQALKIESSANVSGVAQTNYADITMAFGWTAAIVSDDNGSSKTDTSKATAQEGNVCIPSPNPGGKTVIDGGVLANGRVNYPTNDVDLSLATSTVSMTNWGTANQVPDYTIEGGTDQLFDFARFTNAGRALGIGTNYFTNLATFITAMNKAVTNPAQGYAMEGIVVVTPSKADLSTKLTLANLPNGIKIRGTLVFNFQSDVVGLDKLWDESNLYVNAANMTGVVGTNPATYKSGYPPVYTNAAKAPTSATVSNYLVSKGFEAFKPDDDLPAIMYNVGIFDIHGIADVCGVVYTPSFIEIENMVAGQTQYFRGMLIAGGGVLVDGSFANNTTNVVSYDGSALDRLATSGTKGKVFKVVRRY